MKVYVIYREIDSNIFPPEAVKFTEEDAIDYITSTKNDLDSKTKYLQLLGALKVRFLYKEMVVL